MKKKYHVGTSGYNYEHWEESFYPVELNKKEWFGYYADHFDTVEINYSFYRWPKEKTVRKWYERSPSGFRYSLKAPRYMTHLKKLKDTGDDLARFYNLGEILGGKMGCFLFQLPPNLHYSKENLEKIKSFAGILDGRKKNVIEFRHESWWNDKVFDVMKENKVGFCSVSGLDMPEDIIKTARIAYFRFHGEEYDTKYPKEELEKYAEAMKHMEQTEVYVYFNNDQNAFAVSNANEMKEILN